MLQSFVVPYTRIAAIGLLRLQVVEIQAPRLVSVGGRRHDAPAGQTIAQQVGEQKRREMVQREGPLEALRGLLARGEQRPALLARTSMCSYARAPPPPARARRPSARGRRRARAPAPLRRRPWLRRATSRTRSGSRPTSATSAPSRASSTAAARPMPRVAPVSMTSVMWGTLAALVGRQRPPHPNSLPARFGRPPLAGRHAARRKRRSRRPPALMRRTAGPTRLLRCHPAVDLPLPQCLAS